MRFKSDVFVVQNFSVESVLDKFRALDFSWFMSHDNRQMSHTYFS